MRIAVDRPRGREATERQTDFINLVAWRQRAEFAANYLTKGRLVAVEGRLQIRQWTTQDGQKRQAAEVVCDNLQGLDRAREPAAQPPGEEPVASDQAGVAEEPEIPGPWEDE
jgi:single-strand DNA-binding protein